MSIRNWEEVFQYGQGFAPRVITMLRELEAQIAGMVSGGVQSVAAEDGSIVVDGTADDPTIRTGTLDAIATAHPPAADWSNNSKKITGLAAGTNPTDAANVSQLGAGGAVSSVFTRTGAVVAVSGDYSKSDVGLGNVDNTTDAGKPVSTAQQTAIDLKVTANAGITGATKTKVTYDTKGLVTSGADATTADIADSSDKRYVTDAQRTVIGNTSGTNTGDQTVPAFATPAVGLGTAAAAGAASTVIRSDSTIVAFDATAPTTQAFGDAAAVGTAAVAARRDHKHAMPATPTTVSGNAGTATALQNARTINGTSFDGTANIITGQGKLTRSARSSNTVLAAADNGTVICATAAYTQTLTAAATLGAGWWCIVKNDTSDGTTVLTLDPNASETIDGLTTAVMYSGETRLIECDGSNFFSQMLAGGYAKFTPTGGSFVVPAGIAACKVVCIGSGGQGGGGFQGGTGAGGTGGGGGACTFADPRPTELGTAGTSITVTVPAGGTGSGAPGAPGQAGADGSATTFGTLLRAGGGGGGAGGPTGSNPGGGGGGSAVSTASGITAGAPNAAAGSGGQAGSTSGNGAGSCTEWGGAAGGGTASGGTGKAGGSSIYGGPGGGGGGAGASAAAAGGTNQVYTAGSGGGAGTSGASPTGGGNSAATTPNPYCGKGGGGGGGTATAAVTAGNGGTGGIGAGGGGGGAGTNATSVGGTGGAGGAGEARVWYS